MLNEKFSEKRVRNQDLKNLAVKHFDSEEGFREKAYKRFLDCSTWLDFIADYDFSKRKLKAANFCKWRFCPMCAWRKAFANAFKINVIMSYMFKVLGLGFLFMTFTAPRVPGEELKEAIKHRNAAIGKLFKRREVVKINKGYQRKLEVTYDGDVHITKAMYKRKKEYFDRRGLKPGNLNPTYDTYHPHHHLVMAVRASEYFGRNYVQRDRWLEMWQESMKNWDITQVDVRKITPRHDETSENLVFDVFEFTKYQAKDEDYKASQEVFDVFVGALKGTKNFTYNGIFAEVSKMFDDGKLDDFIEPDTVEYYWQLIFKWGGKEYEELKPKEISLSDKLSLIKMGLRIDERDSVPGLLEIGVPVPGDFGELNPFVNPFEV